jgi:hypothetical protein
MARVRSTGARDAPERQAGRVITRLSSSFKIEITRWLQCFKQFSFSTFLALQRAGPLAAATGRTGTGRAAGAADAPESPRRNGVPGGEIS